MKMPNDNAYRLHIQRIDNETFMASVIGPGNDTSVLEVLHGKQHYDDSGALTYVVAVLFLYGFSVFFIIASLVKKTAADHGVSTYMSDLDKIRQLEGKQRKKIKVKKVLKRIYEKKERRARGSKQACPPPSPKETGAPELLHPLWPGMESSSRQSSNWSLSSSYHEEEEVNYLLPPATQYGTSSPTTPRSPELRLDMKFPELTIPPVVSVVPPDHAPPPDTAVTIESQPNPYKLKAVALDTLHEVDEELVHIT